MVKFPGSQGSAPGVGVVGKRVGAGERCLPHCRLRTGV